MLNLIPILENAFKKGEKAMRQCMPTPQRFYSADLSGKQLDKGSVETEGDCGGAYVDGLEGNSEVVRFFKRKGKYDGLYSYILPDGTRITKGVYKGYRLVAPTSKIYNGQSHERYKAFYQAYVTTLKENGIKCYAKDYLT